MSAPAAPLTLFSVVIPARDEEASLPPTLRAIHAEFSRAQIPHELIVVDDGSSDATAARVREVARRDARVLLITQPNGGKSSAMNNGVAAASGDVIRLIEIENVRQFAERLDGPTPSGATEAHRMLVEARVIYAPAA